MTPRPRWRRRGRDRPRRDLRRGVIILPSAFTLGNLFFGLYAMISAVRGDFVWAAWCIVIAVFLDYLDGRVARFTRTGSDFGAQLDSLTDAISFGVAPALVMVMLYFQQSEWGWVIGFGYVTAVVLRLARFNIEQGGEARRHFHGFPTPAAGLLLTSHYPFTLAPLVQEYMGTLPWPRIMVITTVLVSLLMVSHVPYPKMPRLDLRSRRGIVQTTLVGICILLIVLIPAYWVFPLMVGYALWGLLRSVFLGLLERLPERDPLLDAPDSMESAVEPREVDYQELTHELDSDEPEFDEPVARDSNARARTVGERDDEPETDKPDIIHWKENRS